MRRLIHFIDRRTGRRAALRPTRSFGKLGPKALARASGVQRLAPPALLLLRGIALAGAATMFAGCSSLLYFPDRFLHTPPEKAGFAAPEEFKLRASDGGEVGAWWFAPRGPVPPRGVIVQFHGNGENMSSHYVSMAWLTDHGYGLLAFDYRGYGPSPGSPDPEGTVLDGIAALTEAQRRLDAFPKTTARRSLVTVGQSLGGAVLLGALARWPDAGRVDLVVMDSTFWSYRRVARSALRKGWLTWPLQWLPWIVLSDRWTGAEALSQGGSRRRWLFIHDEFDPVVPFSEGEATFTRVDAAAHKELWRLRSGTHTAAFHPEFPRGENLRARLLVTLAEL